MNYALSELIIDDGLITDFEFESRKMMANYQMQFDEIADFSWILARMENLH